MIQRPDRKITPDMLITSLYFIYIKFRYEMFTASPLLYYMSTTLVLHQTSIISHMLYKLHTTIVNQGIHITQSVMVSPVLTHRTHPCQFYHGSSPNSPAHLKYTASIQATLGL